MGVLLKLVDLTLFVFFLAMTIFAPAIGAQALVWKGVFPSMLVELRKRYASEFGDYLVSETPHFYVGLVWLELLFQWPLSLLNLYAIFASKSWFNTTCLISGVSVLTSMAAILSDMIGSGRASDKLLYIHYPFLGFAILAMLRGLFGKGDLATNRKKQA